MEFTSLSVGAFVVRVRADGRTGREAWKLLRERHPWFAWGAIAYVTLLLVAVGALMLAVVAEAVSS
ncbi:hypothetical protein CLM62_06465 [Streptomyces sp. SA15]|nr:hypothetical protein CLM62_06465 [Streptomyces sp. SA15]